MDENSIGIRFVSKKETERGNPDLYLALEQAENFGATAVYFRFYNDNKPLRPQVYIYDRTELKQYPESDADIHHLISYIFTQKLYKQNHQWTGTD